MLFIFTQLYNFIIRPLLFCLHPETAQKIGTFPLRFKIPVKKIFEPINSNILLTTDYCGIKISNPVGTSAGLDKDCIFVPGILSLGFGYLTVGTITVSPLKGNPSPRIIRDTKQKAIVNALGFPNNGVQSAIKKLDSVQQKIKQENIQTPIIASISGTNINDIVYCHKEIEPLVNAIEINISSPNTKGLKIFHEKSTLTKLLTSINDIRNKPLVIKMPHLIDSNKNNTLKIPELLEMVFTIAENNIDGITIANSMPIIDNRLSTGNGGMSGKPLFNNMIKIIQEIHKEFKGKIKINACGGIFSGQDAWTALQAGADTIQIYSSFIYRGPTIASLINSELLKLKKNSS